MIPTEAGWYIARRDEDSEWVVIRLGRGLNFDTLKDSLYVSSEPSTDVSDWQFHSRIPMPDATPEETPEERKSNDGE